jgi:hypothetical protein
VPPLPPLPPLVVTPPLLAEPPLSDFPPEPVALLIPPELPAAPVFPPELVVLSLLLLPPELPPLPPVTELALPPLPGLPPELLTPFVGCLEQVAVHSKKRLDAINKRMGPPAGLSKTLTLLQRGWAAFWEVTAMEIQGGPVGCA